VGIGVGGASSVEVDKIKLRLTEVEKVLMANQLTMKYLGEQTGDDASVSNGRKSHGKFDQDWTLKVETKLTKVSRALKLLMNKLNDLRTATGHKRSHSVLSGISDGSLRYRNAAHTVGSTPGLQNERIKRVYNDSQGTLEENDSPDFNYPGKRRQVHAKQGSLSPQGGSAGRKNVKHGPPMKTNQLMTKISDLIKYTINKTANGMGAPGQPGSPGEAGRRGRFPIVNDVQNYLVMN
jgi:hypothetical protein